MLKDCALRDVRKEWATEAKERSRVGMLQGLMGKRCKAKVSTGREEEPQTDLG